MNARKSKNDAGPATPVVYGYRPAPRKNPGQIGIGVAKSCLLRELGLSVADVLSIRETT
jgi:hypothetical protein